MKKTLLTTSEIIAVAIAVVIVVMSVGILSDTVLNVGKSSVQPKLAVGVDESSLCFDANDIESVRSSLNVIYTNKHGHKTAVLGYKLSASVQDDVCVLSISYNGLTTTVKIDALQK